MHSKILPRYGAKRSRQRRATSESFELYRKNLKAEGWKATISADPPSLTTRQALVIACRTDSCIAKNAVSAGSGPLVKSRIWEWLAVTRQHWCADEEEVEATKIRWTEQSSGNKVQPSRRNEG
jgi:hypothetical protein